MGSGADVNFCDFCCELTTAEAHNDAGLHYLPGSKGLSVLNEHLRLYFVVSKLLNCSTDDCLVLLTIASEGRSNNILEACNKCNKIIFKALQLNEQIGALKSRIVKLGRNLVNRVSQSGWTKSYNIKENCTVLSHKLRELLLKNHNVKLELETVPDECISEDFNFEDGFDAESGTAQEEQLLANQLKQSLLHQIDACNYEYPDQNPLEDKKEKAEIDKNASKIYTISSDENYHCKLCESTYTSFTGIKKHGRMHNESNLLGNIYDCTICRHPNTSDANLRRHISTVHGTQKEPENVHVAKRNFLKDSGDSDSDYNPQVGSSDRDAVPTYSCFLCKSVYTATVAYKKHMRIHQESDKLGNKYDCPTCRHPTLSERVLHRHITVAHQKFKENEIDGQADGAETSTTISTGKNYADTTKDADNENKKYTISSDANFHCKLCESTYTSFTGIKKHGRMHNESTLLGNIYDCKICRHPNTSEANLRRHMNTVHVTQKGPCKSGDAFNADFVREVLEDSENSKFDHDPVMGSSNRLSTKSCDLCESVFTTPVAFKKHMLIHKASDQLGNKFDCPTCRHPTVTERNLRRHLTTVHQNSSNRDSYVVIHDVSAIREAQISNCPSKPSGDSSSTSIKKKTNNVPFTKSNGSFHCTRCESGQGDLHKRMFTSLTVCSCGCFPMFV